MLNEIMNEKKTVNEKISLFLEERYSGIRSKVKKMEKNNIRVGLYILTDNSSNQSKSYMKAKIKLGDLLGIDTRIMEVKTNIDVIAALRTAETLGYKTILQEPCDAKLKKTYEFYHTNTDADGFFTWNDTSKGMYECSPCTSTGILNFLKWDIGSLRGMTMVVVGRGDLSGKPMALQFINEGCTVISANSATPRKQLIHLLKMADVVVCATGAYGAVKKSYLNPNTIIMDVGISFATGKISGEFVEDTDEFEVMSSKTPGGTGRLTVATLFENVIGGV